MKANNTPITRERPNPLEDNKNRVREKCTQTGNGYKVPVECTIHSDSLISNRRHDMNLFSPGVWIHFLCV